MIEKLAADFPGIQVEEDILSVISEMLHISFIIIQIEVKDGENKQPSIRVIGFEEDMMETVTGYSDISQSPMNRNEGDAGHISTSMANQDDSMDSSVSPQVEATAMQTTVAPTKGEKKESGMEDGISPTSNLNNDKDNTRVPLEQEAEAIPLQDFTRLRYKTVMLMGLYQWSTEHQHYISLSDYSRRG